MLDPFCGSGTTLVQANELGIHGIGIDISAFNCMISNVKVEEHKLYELHDAVRLLTQKLDKFVQQSGILQFDDHLSSLLSTFNAKYFPSPNYRRKVASGEIDEVGHASQKEQKLESKYQTLVSQYNIQLTQSCDNSFLGKWLVPSIREEVQFMRDEIHKFTNRDLKNVLSVILSRTVRSCRATKHADLGTLKVPTTKTYYCKKHGKMCKPLFSIISWWKRYSIDTLKRLQEFSELRTNTYQACVRGDSRTINLVTILGRKSLFSKLIKENKIRGIFSSPPYVGLIDYHEQHAYAYELFDISRDDELEIGPLFSGQGQKAQAAYVTGIAATLKNCKPYLQEDYDIFLVANDKHNLYPRIAEYCDMVIVNQFKRPVLCRVEKDRSTAFSETIFRLKDKSAC